jgi:hypothetical protein
MRRDGRFETTLGFRVIVGVRAKSQSGSFILQFGAAPHPILALTLQLRDHFSGFLDFCLSPRLNWSPPVAAETVTADIGQPRLGALSGF